SDLFRGTCARMTAPHTHTSPDLPDDETIIPADFTPLGREGRGPLLRLSLPKLAVAAALLVFAAAGWFVLTAKSVFFDVRPLDSQVSVAQALALQVGPRYLIPRGDIDVRVEA